MVEKFDILSRYRRKRHVRGVFILSLFLALLILCHLAVLPGVSAADVGGKSSARVGSNATRPAALKQKFAISSSRADNISDASAVVTAIHSQPTEGSVELQSFMKSFKLKPAPETLVSVCEWAGGFVNA